MAPAATEPPSPTPASADANAAAAKNTPSPTPAAAQEATPTATPAQAGQAGVYCLNKAAFYDDVTIPDGTVFRQGDAFVKTWRLKNEGTCTWGPAYKLAFAGGDSMNGPQTMPLPEVKAGDIFDLSVNLTAPANGGTYVGHYVFMDPQGGPFGVNAGGIDDIWVKIVVSYIVPGQDPKPTPDPAAPPPSAEVPGCTFQPNDSYLSQVLALINQARTAANLPALTLNAKLAAAAQVHSVDMACRNYWGHIGSDGSDWYARVKAQKYNYAYASENVYVGSPQYGGDAQGAFDWWWKSPIHHDNMMSKKVTEIGIGYAFTTTSQYGGYYTIDFGKPVFGK